jgi:hypothetical protein
MPYSGHDIGSPPPVIDHLGGAAGLVKEQVGGELAAAHDGRLWP